ncbi:aspartate aminotransferase family protein [Saliphagus sp. LR7]|uniref:aspartate aminotransferase family protein n=1 Tax=Saliphagus sp. LR7 TaxID=2282654 RepID=UPI000DF747B1|nr:aspartate aminotransferase family protein [Saliphagus sp. LR7]
MPNERRISSNELANCAKDVIPGGVNSYARKFEREINFDRGQGSKIYDLDGNEYVDYLNAWGAILLGHCDSEVNEAVTTTLAEQDLYGYGTTELEVEVAKEIVKHVPSAEKVLFGVTGSEVVARAITLARAVTGGKKVIKFQGTYHGWYDSVAMNHLSEPEKLGTRDVFTEGLLEQTVAETIILPFNDLNAVQETVKEHSDELAGIILEPVAHNMGCVLPADGFLDGLRRICDENGILLIFDEIITGFRHDMGGVQQLEGVIPDLTTLGKGIANGYPLSVLCGKEKYMDRFQTKDGGDVSFGGTYNSHAASMAAAKTSMQALQERDFHKVGVERRDRICDAFEDLFEDYGVVATVKRYGTVFLTYFMEPPIQTYQDVLRNDDEKYHAYRQMMIDEGILMVPKPLRRNYLLERHTTEDVERTIEAAKPAIASIKDD